jgi:hypothetical protein
MALAESEKVRIREYLGWGARFAQFDSALERAMDAIDSGPFAETEDRVREHLTELARIDAALVAAEARLKADVVGSITLNRQEIQTLRSRGAERVGRLATALQVEVRDNPFSPDLPRFRGTPYGPRGGGGNAQRQG